MMTITVNGDFKIFTSTKILGFVGENNARIINVDQPDIGADTYALRIEYPDGVIYDAEIVDSKLTVTGSMLRAVGIVNCQWVATKGDELIGKSNIFELQIGNSIDDGTAVPTYEQTVTALQDMKTQANIATQKATEISENAEQIQTTKTYVDKIIPNVSIDNLIDYDKITAKYILNTNGEIVSKDDYNVTDYIPVSQDCTYYHSHLKLADTNNSIFAFYDTDKNLISTVKTGGSEYERIKIDVPDGAAYMRMNVQETTAEFIQIRKIKSEEIENQSITADKISGAVKTANMFPIDTEIHNTLAGNYSNNKFWYSTSAKYNITGLIPVTYKNDTLQFKIFDNTKTGSLSFFAYYFDTDKTPIGASKKTTIKANGTITVNFTPVENTAYVRVQIPVALTDCKQYVLCYASEELTEYTQQYVLPTCGDVVNNYYNGDTTITYTNDSNYDWFNTQCQKNAMLTMARLGRTAVAYSDRTASQISLAQEGDTYGHDAQIAWHNATSTLYVLYTANQVTKGDSASDKNAFLRLQKVSASATSTTMSLTDTITVCKNGDTIGDYTVSSGAGTSNCYLVGNVLHMIWIAKLSDNRWHVIHGTYDCSTSTMGTPELCKIGDDDMTAYNISALAGNAQNNQIGINAKIAYDGTSTFYACVCVGTDTPNGVIMKTTDFVNWEFVSVPQFNGITSQSQFEGAMEYYKGYLYLLLRQIDLDASSEVNPIVFARLDTDGNVIDNCIVPSGTSRPSFYQNEDKLYALIPTTDRYNTIVLNVKPKLRDSYPFLDIVEDNCGNYMQVVKRTKDTVFAVWTVGSTGVRVANMDISSNSNTDIMTKFKTNLMG